MNRNLKRHVFSIIAFGLITLHAHAVEFSIFGDAALVNDNTAGQDSSFTVGAVDFFATAPIDDKSRAFIEFVFENRGDGLVTDLERIWVSRDLTDNITVAAGRFHSPLGYWNRTYHHGSFIQETISRPFFLDFEDGAGGVLPLHTVGLMSWGEINMGEGVFSYEVALSNGSSINSDAFGFTATAANKPEIEINDSGDNNSNKSLSARLRYSADMLPISGSIFFNQQKVAESGNGAKSGVAKGGELLDQTISGVDIQGQFGALDLKVEYYNFNHDSNLGSGKTTDGQAYYLQFGWQLSEDLKLFVRNESLDFDNNDVWFSLLGATTGTHNLLAARYDLSESNALKFEVNRDSPDKGPDRTTLSLQWTFMIP